MVRVHQVVEESLAGILEQFYHRLEVLLAAVVGVGHGAEVGMAAQKLCYVYDFVARGLVGGEQGHVVQVFSVHAHEQVEAGEVVAAYLAGVMVEVVAVAQAMAPHSAVGQLAHMPVAYAGRVDMEELLHASQFCEVAHDAFSSRRAADIAEAHEKYFCFHTV